MSGSLTPHKTVMDFDTKIAIVVRDDLATWQKLNVTAFLTSGVTGADQSLLGEDYQDALGNSYSPLLIQPIIVLSADGNKIKTIYPPCIRGNKNTSASSGIVSNQLSRNIWPLTDIAMPSSS